MINCSVAVNLCQNVLFVMNITPKHGISTPGRWSVGLGRARDRAVGFWRTLERIGRGTLCGTAQVHLGCTSGAPQVHPEK